MIQDPFGVFLALAGAVFLAVWLEGRYRFFRAMSAGLMCLVFGMILSNSGLLPGDAEAYYQLGNIWVNAAIVLVLLNVDLRTLLAAGKPMLGAFGIGAVGTMLGTAVATFLLAGAIGPETWKLTGQFTGTYIGGGANFYALASAFGTDPNIMSGAVAADVIVTACWLATCLVIPALLYGGKGLDPVRKGDAPLTLEQRLKESGESLRMMDFFGLSAITLGAMVAARLLAAAVPVVPAVLWLTTIALVLGHTPPVRKLRGAPVLGNSLLYLFLAGNGAQSLVSEMLAYGPSLFFYALITVGIHGLVIFGIGRLLRFDAGTLVVASQANIGGAASAVAIATARGYGDKLLPGIAVALGGYAFGNYLGFGMGTMARTFLGG
ncbi:MAG: DUF819 family protein [Acidobacteria bacterium]|nr:DUF819 family protein [Acidobacteriota bacterium]MYH22344.1 DUF819 family protein [Acidobacteriota bacterium]MYK80420.1 DUF819 family protein [Acidobacteriota bacterium]